MKFENPFKKSEQTRREEIWGPATEAWAIAEEMYGNVARTGGTKIDKRVAFNFVEKAKEAILILEKAELQGDEAEEAQKTITELREEIERVEREVGDFDEN